MNSELRCLVLCTTVLSGCATNEAPSDGGFISGVKGVASGSYQDRVDERQENVDSLGTQESALREEEAIKSQEIARNAQEISRLEGELEQVKFEIEISLARIRQLDRALTAQERQTVARARERQTLAAPGASVDAERLEALKNTITQANLLAEQLSKIGA
ncbi:MAG: hypothetical protein AAFN27_13625 [Pseudomonadota bacterium]